MGNKKVWTNYQIPETDYTIQYRIEPGAVITECFGQELRFENLQKIIDFYKVYFEAIHYCTDYNPPTIEMGVDCE